MQTATDDQLIMCEQCGQDILQSEAVWSDCDDGRVPLCPSCTEWYADYNPAD